MDINEKSEIVPKIEFYEPRKLFINEATKLTPWLEQNIDALGDRLSLSLEVVEREKSVGSFSLDLLCQTSDGIRVIIENQIERTDHDHLGKLLTYMVNLDAKIAIWVTSEARSEHSRVIDWLNQITPADTSFYLVRIEAVKIEDSKTAPLFTIVAGPDSQTKQMGDEKKDLAERDARCFDFWNAFLSFAREKRPTGAYTSLKPGLGYSLGVWNGITGANFYAYARSKSAAVDLYIGFASKERNKRIFDILHNEKDEIERIIGQALDWKRMDEKLPSRIVLDFENHGLDDESDWPTVFEFFVDTLDRFSEAFCDRVRNAVEMTA